MKRDEILATLRAHEPELRAVGLVRLSLFGASARDQARADSDIGLLASMSAPCRCST
jgi:predicted nucleotidyltransferase